MKRILTTIVATVALCTSVMAVAVSGVTGTFSGQLNIGGTLYPDKEVYLLPGTEDNTVTFVLPDFMFGAASLGDIVLVNIPMDASGQLTLAGTPLYIKAITERAMVSVLSGSSVSSSAMMISLSIEVSSLPEPLSVVFDGARTNKNYDFANGGFEGAWTNNEPNGWHSFPSATGNFAAFVSGNTDQFTQSTDVRPGSTGSHSARLQSASMFGVKANGNCTNGQISAGSMTASDGSKNYNVSDPSNAAYNTPFVGNPDSLVFWAKYIPADQNPSNASNRARAHAVVTTNARYQDPESSDYSAVKIADAEVNYSAVSSLDWQRIAVPFTYYSVAPDKAAYMLMTFTTNEQPGGGTTSGSSVDNIYLDDVQMIYNYQLTSLKIDGVTVSFTDGVAQLSNPYSDSEYVIEATTNGKAAQTFIGYDAAQYRAYVYVLPHNYAQAQQYTVYTLQMTEPSIRPNDTYYTYTATFCAGQIYEDDAFQGLTEEGTYTTRMPNSQSGDSVITLELHELPSYVFDEQMYVSDADTVWRGQPISGLEFAEEPYLFYDSLHTQEGCDSVYRLQLYVTTVPRTYGDYTAKVCEGDSVEYEGVYYAQAFEGDIQLAQLNHYGGDSIVHLTVQILPNYTIEEYMTIRQGENKTWEGIQLSTLPAGVISMNASYFSIHDCDSTRILHLTVLSTSKPWTGTDSVSMSDVCGRYDGELNIGGTPYADKSMFVLPGTMDSTITLVLPDFTFNGGKLGHIVLPNIPMSAVGQLMLDNRSLYLDSISERATVTMINGLKEGAVTYYSVLANDKAQVVLYIETPSLPEAILVFFQGDAVRNNNYRLPNGGFEGAWTNNEPKGWHSFGTATGEMADFVKANTFQFVPSYEVRPGSTGAQSVLLSSNMIMGVKANGNCTNGQINAGSISAGNAAGNYNFSDPSNSGYNTPFHGRPDSIVFWTKYVPADRNVTNAENKARMSTVITTDARYQDPEETEAYDNVKIGSAWTNYSATAEMGWQRIAVPFTYSAATANAKPAYVLTTFTTNYQPGGGSSYTTTGSNRTNVLDSVYVDDVEMVYNKRLRAFYHGAEAVDFEQYVAHVNDTYCDDCASYEAFGNGVSAQSFIAFDAEHRCIAVYVIADDYAQTLDYRLYRVEFEDSQTADLQPINPSQDVETVRTNCGAYEKVLYNGQLYIRQGDNWYTISGIKIK